MARESRSPIARADSQVFPRATETTLAQTFYKRIDGSRRKDETFSASRSRSDEKTVARHCLATDYFAQVVGKMFERREAAGLGVEMNKIETPAALLMAAVLTDDPIKPALKSTCQVEIGPVDREHERVVQYTAVEPVRQDQRFRLKETGQQIHDAIEGVGGTPLPVPSAEAGVISDLLVNGKNWMRGIEAVER